jgi:protocatechuate 3,4-dioxygenase beta subunit
MCTVSGRVVTAADGVPLKSSRVALMPEHEGRKSSTYAATSDGAGRFTIKDVPAGRYRFFAAHSGYVDQHYQSTGGESDPIFTLRAGQEVKDVLFRMTPAAVITGRINDEDGDPMVQIKVIALRAPTEEDLEDEEDRPSQNRDLSPAGLAQTDDRGQYRIFGLKPGEYYVEAVDEYEPVFHMTFGNEWELREALGSQYAPVYYPGVTQVGQAEAVLIAPGEDAQVDLVLKRVKTVEVSGHVIGADGKPATDAYVYLEELAADYGVSHGGEADVKGEFKIKGVAPGSYILHAGQRLSDDAHYHARQQIEVGSDNLSSITLALGRGASFDGRVETSGSGTTQLDRIYLSLHSHDSEIGGAWARVKKDGTFQLLDVPDGTFAFSIGGLDEGWYVKSVRLGPDNLLADGLSVEKGAGGGTIRIVVTKGGAELEGTVTQDDKPLIGARVRITPDPETPYNHMLRSRATTDQGGHFSVIGLAPGQYRVVAKASVTSGGNTLASDPKGVSVTERDHKTIDLTIPSPPTP